MKIDLTASKAIIVSTLRAEFGSSVKVADLWSVDPKVCNWAKRNLKKIARGVFELGESSSEKPKTHTDAEIATHIRERFSVLTMLADGISASEVRSLIVSGAAGVGKTHTLEQSLNAAVADKKLSSVTMMKGTISGIGLFVTLWENRSKGNVLVLDDVDPFGDEEVMNVLKAALDSSKVRRITWMKDSAFLRDRGIDNTFEYEGQIVFITNKDIDGIIAKDGKMAPHMSALVSRSIFLDLAIHDPRSIMIRIEQVLAESQMAADLKLKASEVAQIIGWMRQNLDKLRHLSLRTVIQLASFMKTSPTSWQMLSTATQLKNRF